MKKIIIYMTVVFTIIVVIYIAYNYGKPKKNDAESTDFIMGTVVSQVIYGRDALSCIGENVECIEFLEDNRISWRKRTSELFYINKFARKKKEYPISDELYGYLQQTRQLAEDSGGALDPTIRPLVKLWGIERENPVKPEQEDIDKRLTYVDYHNFELMNSSYVKMVKGTKLDLGAVGKGIACDEVYNILRNRQVDGAVISVGGSILTYGCKPDGEDWIVAIRDPLGDEDSTLGTLNLIGTNFISTSGSYEKYFIEDGITYHHILDPSTGYPANSGLTSVTIVCDNGLDSDGLSTACFILGYENSLPLLEKYNAEAIFVTVDNEIIITEGLKYKFTLSAEGYNIVE